jgi:hypothetical protein
VGEREFMPQSFAGEHRWIIDGGLCDVEGQLHVAGATTAFRGVGYRDHHYGNDLPAQRAQRWFHGRAIGEDGSWCVAFHHVEPSDWRLGEEAHVIEIDESGVGGEVEVEANDVHWKRANWPTRSLLSYPIVVRFGDVLTLTRGRVVASSPCQVQLMYDAEHRGKRGRALCSSISPRRLQGFWL